jgi:hypothetical protein
VRVLLFTFNTVLTSNLGLRFAVGGSFKYIQFLLIAFPPTVSGFFVSQALANPLAGVLLALAILYGRGIQDVPDPSVRCKAICKVAEEYNNKQLAIEMKKFNLVVEDISTGLQFPID